MKYFSFFFMLVLIGCGTDKSEPEQVFIPYQEPITIKSLDLSCNKLKTIKWDTMGGGDMHFTLTLQDSGLYYISGISFDHGKKLEDFEVGEENEEFYEIVNGIFNFDYEIQGIEVEERSTEGSWTFLTFEDNCENSEKLKSPKYIDDGSEGSFSFILNLVDENIIKSDSN